MNDKVINNRAKSKNCTCGNFWTQPYSYTTPQGAKMMATKCYGQDVKKGDVLTKVVADEFGRWHIALAVLNGGCSECGRVQQTLIVMSHINFELAQLNKEKMTAMTAERMNHLFEELRNWN